VSYARAVGFLRAKTTWNSIVATARNSFATLNKATKRFYV